jgi:predicted lipid-binding transport protein (Tim44 family)
MKTLWLAVIAVFAAATIGLADAEAKKLGGGRSIGKQAPDSTMQRGATPSAPAGAQGSAQAGPSAAPAAPAAAPAAAAPRPGAPAAAPAAAGGNRWLGPVAGIAAGLGLAALASHLGFGEELASFMLIALMAIAALVIVRMVMARRAGARREPAFAGGAAYSGLGQEAAAPRWQPPASSAGGAAPARVAVQPAVETAAGPVPAGFDVEGFVRNAKVYFVRLQAAFDAGDTDDLREFTSPGMFAELKLEIDERQGGANQTDVVSLDARLLGVETGATEHLASVRFSGLLREQPGAQAEPFEEVWNFARPTVGQGGWVLAGIQQIDKA